MYPRQELILLSLRKAAVRREITRLRVQCSGAAVRVTRPLAWIDRVVAFARRLSPLVLIAAVPAGVVAQRFLFPRFKILGLLLRWGPAAFAAARGLLPVAGALAGQQTARASRSAKARPKVF